MVEGADKVNLLTQMNPNTEAIDEQMFKNQNAGVQTATELLNGTVHAITRSVADASMIRFTAVSRFTVGDTFTVDGVQVSALLPSGEQLPDGAFIIGSEVLCVLKGTLLTVFASGGKVALAKDAEKLGGQLPAYYATKTEVDNAQNTANSAGALAESNKRVIDELYKSKIGTVTTPSNINANQSVSVQVHLEEIPNTYNILLTKTSTYLCKYADVSYIKKEYGFDVIVENTSNEPLSPVTCDWIIFYK